MLQSHLGDQDEAKIPEPDNKDKLLEDEFERTRMQHEARYDPFQLEPYPNFESDNEEDGDKTSEADPAARKASKSERYKERAIREIYEDLAMSQWLKKVGGDDQFNPDFFELNQINIQPDDLGPEIKARIRELVESRFGGVDGNESADVDKDLEILKKLFGSKYETVDIDERTKQDLEDQNIMDIKTRRAWMYDKRKLYDQIDPDFFFSRQAKTPEQKAQQELEDEEELRILYEQTGYEPISIEDENWDEELERLMNEEAWIDREVDFDCNQSQYSSFRDLDPPSKSDVEEWRNAEQTRGGIVSTDKSSMLSPFNYTLESLEAAEQAKEAAEQTKQKQEQYRLEDEDEDDFDVYGDGDDDKDKDDKEPDNDESIYPCCIEISRKSLVDSWTGLMKLYKISPDERLVFQPMEGVIPLKSKIVMDEPDDSFRKPDELVEGGRMTYLDPEAREFGTVWIEKSPLDPAATVTLFRHRICRNPFLDGMIVFPNGFWTNGILSTQTKRTGSPMLIAGFGFVKQNDRYDVELLGTRSDGVGFQISAVQLSKLQRGPLSSASSSEEFGSHDLASDLLGQWSGFLTCIQPLVPRNPLVEDTISSSWRLGKAKLEDLTWIKETEDPDKINYEQVWELLPRGNEPAPTANQKRKMSKSVKQAIQRDRERAAKNNLVFSSRIGSKFYAGLAGIWDPSISTNQVRLKHLETDVSDQLVIMLHDGISVSFPAMIQEGCRFEIEAAWIRKLGNRRPTRYRLIRYHNAYGHFTHASMSEEKLDARYFDDDHEDHHEDEDEVSKDELSSV